MRLTREMYREFRDRYKLDRFTAVLATILYRIKFELER